MNHDDLLGSSNGRISDFHSEGAVSNTVPSTKNNSNLIKSEQLGMSFGKARRKLHNARLCRCTACRNAARMGRRKRLKRRYGAPNKD